MLDGMNPTGHYCATRRKLWCAVAIVLCAASPACAAELYSGNGMIVRWDNTLTYSAAFRVAPRDAAILSEPNSDDGDRNFAPGLISNRIDLASALDVTGGDVGLHADAVAWYDTVYHARTDNSSPGTYNAVSVPATQFPRATRNLLGQYANLEEAFVFGDFEADGMPLSVRIGRQTVIWGESLFFAENSIAAALAPVDEIRTAGAPGSYSKEVFLPVAQAAFTLQPAENLSLSFTYQFEWRKSRLPGVGSYFSYYDFYDTGGERLFLDSGYALHRAKDRHPPSGGQFGVSLHASLGDFDIGLYALRYHAKEPQIWLRPASGTYQLFYPSGIELYGLSFATYLGDSSFSGEISARRNMPLVSRSPVSQYWSADDYDPTAGGYAAGDTLHAQVSSTTEFGPAALWDSAEFGTEVAANGRLAVTANPAALDPHRDRFALSLRALFEPRYFQVLPNLDLGVPIGVGYNAIGRSSVLESQYAGSGDFEIGLDGTYRTVWKAGISVTAFLGSAYHQPFADRDFVRLTLERSF
jgi:Protein of unknown function (DUF1302)